MTEEKSFVLLRRFVPFPIAAVPLELQSRVRWLISRYSAAIQLKNDSKEEQGARRKRWTRFWHTITKVERSIIHTLYIGGSFSTEDAHATHWRYTEPKEAERLSLSDLHQKIVLHYLPVEDLCVLLGVCKRSNPSLPEFSIEALAYMCDAYAGLSEASVPIEREDETVPVILPDSLQVWQPVIKSIIKTTIEGRTHAAKRQVCITWPPCSLVYSEGKVQQIELQEDLNLGLNAAFMFSEFSMLH